MNTRELDVMNILCAAGEPLTSTQITYEDRTLTQSTVISVLRKLLQDELVSVAGVTHSGKVLSRTYVPGPRAKEAVIAHYIEQFRKTKSVLTCDELINIVKGIYQEG